MNNKIRFSLLTLLVMLCGTVFADTYTYEFTKQQFTAAGTKALGDANWTLTTGTTYFGWDTQNGKGQQFGSGGNPAKSLVLATSDITGTISEIKVTTSGASSIAGTLDVTVGGSAFGNQYNLTSTSTEVTFTGSASGEIKLNYAQTSSKAIYIKKIEVTYASAAPEPEPYTVDFNKTIAVPTSNTNTPDFAVSVGWARKAQSATGDGYGPYYMMYTYSSTLGVDGTGTLGANAQQAPQSTYDGTISKVNDYIITPKVSGTVTLQVKGNSSASSTYPSEIKFFAIDDDATTVGDEIVATFSDNISSTSWVTATLTLTEATRLAIKAQWVYMDNFTATTAEIPEVKSITVLKVADQVNGNEGSTGVNPKFEQLADGNMLVKLKVTLQNTGNVALTTASDGFTLTPAWATYSTGTKTYFEDAKVAIPEDLAIDETKTFDIDFTVPYTYGSNGYIDWFVKENVSGTTSSSYRYAQSIPYEPKFVFRVFEGTETASLTTAQDYGLVKEETTKQFEIYNDGAAPLIIKSITLPEGFTSADAPVIPTEGLSIAKFSKQALDITLPTTASGAVGGNLVIVYLDKEGAEQTYQLAFSGKMLDASKWMAAFDSDNWNNPTWPEGTVHLTNIKGGYQYVSTSNYNWWLTTGGSGSGYKSNNWFITPKLHATAGEKFSFDVKRNSSTGDYYVKVYLSTDRKTWGEPVKTIANSELTSDFQSFFIEAAAEGDYYVGFEIFYVSVDNLFGFAPVEGITHDIYLVKSTLPTETQSGKKITPSMEIIPVIAETADAYTVKYYVNGTAVATAESTDLTAGSNKTFSIEYTPEVEATTEFTTYIAMELTDGTVLAKSDEATLKVTKEPKFLFVTAGTSISQYTTSVTAAQQFGKVNTATEKKSFKIANNGTAVLKVKSITAPEGFQASVAGPVEVAAGETLDVDITFNAATPGAYSGNLAIVYEKDAAGTEDTYELAFSGTMLDVTKFYATFGTSSDLSNLPAGSLVQSNVSLTTPSTDNACLSTSSSTKNLFITPLMTTAEATTIEFSARARSYYSAAAVKVYAVSDHIAAANTETDDEFLALNPTLLKDVGVESTTFEVFTVDVPAGTSYIAFKIEDAYVDDIYGMSVSPVAHEWQIASNNIPAEAMQNVAKTVSVNIRNIGQQAEAADGYTMTVFVDGAAVATGETVALPMNHKLTDAGTQISASFRYPKIGTFPVYIEVKAGEYSVATEPVDVTFTEEVAVAEAIEVGTKSGADKSHGPVDWYNNDGSGTNWTDIVYTAKQLDDFGIKAGDKITSIAFKGSGTAKSIKAAITSWVGVKTGDITPGTVDKDAMTKVVVYDQADEAATIDFSLFNIDLSSNPIVWDGTSDIRIYTEAIRQGNSNWQTVTYEYDSNYMNSYFKSTTPVATPLGYFTLAVEPAIFSGTVKNDTGAAIEGATITLVSTDGDNVQYAGTTNAEGAYSINVIQASREYDVTMKAEGYDDQVVTIKFDGESQTKNFVVSNGNAVPLDIAAGWQQITALPENLGDYYFAIADKTENLMLSMARGKNQGGEYNGLYYKTGADAFVDKSMLFTLEANDAYVVMTNAEYNSLMIQTEWNAPHFYRTHDNGGGDKAWGRVKFTYSDDAKAWTIQNGKYFEENANFLGTWSGNVPANAEEMALNKSAEQKGLFRLYAIEKAKYNEYKANLLAADGDEPVDMTALIVNPNANFWTGSQAYGWDVVGNKNVNTATGADDFPCFFEYSDWGAASWKNSIKQTITVPNGYYELKARMMMADGVIAYLTANDQKSENAAIAGTNPYFPNHLSVEVKVVDGKLTIGAYAEASAKELWVNTDNFTLTFLRGLPNASESDYAALAEAIQTADAKTLGFDKDEYAPYANVEAVKALTAAKAINPAVKNAPEFVQAATAALTTATWTANANEMNAVYNGDFALCENDGAMAGWQTSSSAGLGGAYHSRAFVLTEGMNNYDNLATFQTGEKHSAGYFRFDGTNSGKDCVYTYGNEAGYTMPLKPIIYKMTAQLGGWGQVDKDVTIAIVDAEDQEIATKIVHTPATGVHAGGEAIPFEFEFTPAVAGNYRLQLKNTNTSVDNAIVISNISIVKGYPAGDANLDGVVTAGDAIATVSFALEVETPSAKAFKAADVNKSNSLTVSDVVGIVNIALINQSVPSAPARVQHVAENNALALNGNILSLANTTEFVAFQMDVTVAPGAQFRGVELSSRASGLNVSYNRVAENTYRVVAFSLSNDAIEMGEGVICTFDIIGNKTVQVTNIEFADAAARAYALELGETTRINGIAAGAAGAEFFSVGGVKSDKAQKGMNVVRTADGKVKKVLVK